ncbi:hypothetical protein PC121_g15544 [Phytophthora cactorum]|nr:hypothetical protein PC121_g15544 [Phytophthora cactorum]
MLLALAQTGKLETVDLKVFVKGHTKNVVDHGFGHIRKRFAKEDVWTTDQLLEVIKESSVSSALVHISKDNPVMKVFRNIVKEAHKDLLNVQRYQLFQMKKANPGVVSCRAGPNEDIMNQDLRRTFDGIRTDASKVRNLLEAHLEPLQPPAPNFEKKLQMHSKIRPYVPVEYRSDPIYDAPTEEEERLANEVKQARRKASAKKKKAAADTSGAKATPTEHTERESTENGTQMNVSVDSPAQPKRGKRAPKRAKKDK